MQKLGLLLLLFFITFSFNSRAQDTHITQQDWEVVTVFHEYHRTFKCDMSSKLLNELNHMSDAELEEKISSEIYDLNYTLKNQKHVLLKGEKKLLRNQRKVLKRLLRTSRRRESVQKFYEDFCKGSEVAIHEFAKGMGHVANAINNGVTFPIRFTYKFFKGLANGEVRHYQRKTFYDTVGRSAYQSVGFLSLYSGFQLLTSTNYYLLPLFATPMADVMVSHVCDNVNEMNPKEVRFCKNYDKVKEKFYLAVQKGEVWGAKLHQKFKKKKEVAPVPDWEGEVTDENFKRDKNDSKTKTQ